MSNISERIKELLSRHIIVADAAIGTTLVGGERMTCPDTLSITETERVEAMYEASIKAGARIITTNTFLSDPLMLKECGVSYSTDEVVAAALSIAR